VLLVPLLPCRVVPPGEIGYADRAWDPAACADRCWVGGLLGGLDGASHTATERQCVKSVHDKIRVSRRCFLDKPKSYQRWE